MYSHGSEFEMAPDMSMNFTSLGTSCVGRQEEEPQTAYPMLITWASLMAASVLMGHQILPNQSIIQSINRMAVMKLSTSP